MVINVHVDVQCISSVNGYLFDSRYSVISLMPYSHIYMDLMIAMIIVKIICLSCAISDYLMTIVWRVS
jgi:hypothetical protein